MTRGPASPCWHHRRDPAEAAPRALRGHHLRGAVAVGDGPDAAASAARGSPERALALGVATLGAVVLAAVGAGAAPAVPVVCLTAYLALFYSLMSERRVPSSPL